jgi:DinB superfamily
MMMEDLQYPIGKFSPKESYTPDELSAFMARIESLPTRLEEAIKSFTDQQLDTPYREGGWTVRQVIHHVADSHLNAYIRCKWTLTEDSPVIKAYNEKLWATTPEAKLDPSISIDLIKAHHRKWVALLKGLSPTDWEKHFIHPESRKEIKIKNLVGLYAWHGDHHLAHITNLKDRMKW